MNKETEFWLTELYFKRHTKVIAPEEAAALAKYKEQHPDEITAFEKRFDVEKLTRDLGIYHRAELARPRFERRILPSGSIAWYRIAVAAVFIGLLIGAALVTTHRNTPKRYATKPTAGDILPGGKKAILTTADGHSYSLDSASRLSLPEVTDKGGVLSYNNSEKPHNGASAVFHTLTTSAGGSYALILPDQTRVWLNNLSSIHYPTTFSGKERAVEVTGEAFFEVAKDATHPFVVQLPGNKKVQVLGTTFVVSSYAQEAAKATLIEGVVKVFNGNKEKILSPGEQASLPITNNEIIVSRVNTLAETAWKDNLFYFHNTPLTEIMHQLSRWYGVDVAFDGPQAKADEIQLSGEISRSNSAAQVLKVLEVAGFKVSIENSKKRIVISTI